jgi:GTP-binding protein
MPIPTVAIVGRPNAGKSSLLNMIAGSKVSIVDPTPGVTRDRVSAIVDLPHPDGSNSGPDKAVEFIDTGGFGVYTAEGARYDEVGADLATLTKDIEEQIASAIETADVVLFAVDAQQGVTPADEQIAKMLREGKLGRAGKGVTKRVDKKDAGKKDEGKGKAKGGRGLGDKVRIVATKVDGPKWEAHAHELAGMGFGDPILCSAKNNYMRRDLMNTLYGLVPGAKAGDIRGESGAQEHPRADLMVAIVGKRNAGKSTLVNTLAGEPRMIVSEIAGTTRDAVDVRFELDGKALVAIDTAGVRRKKSFQSMVEVYALDRAQRAIDRADVVMFLIDSTTKLSQVDEQLAMICQKAFKPVIIVINKWDEEGALGRTNKKGRTPVPEDYEEYIRRELKGLSFAPISFMSAKGGFNVKDTLKLAFDLQEQTRTRVTTGVMNRLVRRIIEKRSPTDKIGSHAKVYYVAQTSSNPPTIHLVVNKPDLFRPAYKRYLLNEFREELPFSEVPIRLVVRPRRQGGPELEGGADRALVARAGQINVRGRTTKDTFVPETFADDFDEVPATGKGGKSGKGGKKKAKAAKPVAATEFEAGAKLDDLGDDAGAYFDDE